MIRIQRVTHIYKKESTKQEVKALDNVSLDIREGEHIAVLGHNGCGKTTTFRLLLGLKGVIPREVSSPSKIQFYRRNA